MKTLNVRHTSNKELTEKWGVDTNFKGELYIRCNSKGVVNWGKSSVYTMDELLKRGNVNIIKPNKVENIKDIECFELIKEYPMSPVIGTRTNNSYGFKDGYRNEYYPGLNYFLNWSEYWKPIMKNDL